MEVIGIYLSLTSPNFKQTNSTYFQIRRKKELQRPYGHKGESKSWQFTFKAIWPQMIFYMALYVSRQGRKKEMEVFVESQLWGERAGMPNKKNSRGLPIWLCKYSCLIY